MAQAAHSAGFKVWTNIAPGGGAIPMWNGLLKSNMAVSIGVEGRGDILYATAGYVQTDATTDQLPVGVAQTGATSTTVNLSFLFYPAVPWLVFTGQYGGTATQAKVWTFHSVAGTCGKQEVSNVSGGKCFWMIGKEPRSSFGAYTDVLFTMCQNKFQPIEFDSSHGIAD